MKDVARRLVVLEAEHTGVAHPLFDTAVQVCEKLRQPLLQIAGSQGYASLLSRALMLAKREIPDLDSVQTLPDGTLTGFADLKTNTGKPGENAADQLGVILIHHLLQLLVTFIGETVVLSILRDSWPNEIFHFADQETEEKS